MPIDGAERSRKVRTTHDQISFLTDKGGRELLRVLALREGVPVAKVLTRAALARAGLSSMPSGEEMEMLAAVDTRDAAEAAIMRLQAQEEPTQEEEATADEYTVTITPDEWGTILDLADQVEDNLAAINRTIAVKGVDAPGTDRMHLAISTEALASLRQLLSNIQRYDKRKP